MFLHSFFFFNGIFLDYVVAQSHNNNHNNKIKSNTITNMLSSIQDLLNADVFQITRNDSSLIDECDEDHMETFNCSREDFLLHERGRQMQDLWDAVSLTLVYGFTVLAGLLGNLIVCVVIVRQSSMRNSTNYYLFNLAVSDMVHILYLFRFDFDLFHLFIQKYYISRCICCSDCHLKYCYFSINTHGHLDYHFVNFVH